MIIDWHSHIYTPEEAAADLGTLDGKSGPKWGERGCPMVIENFLDAHYSNGIDISVVTNAAHYLRGKAAHEELPAVQKWSDYAAEIPARAPRGTVLFRHHSAVRRPGFHQGGRARDPRARAQGHLHSFQPQGPLSRRRRGTPILAARRRSRCAGDDPSAAPGLRRGADEGISPRLEHRAAVRSLSCARAADRARYPRGLSLASRSLPPTAAAASARPSAAWIMPTSSRTRRSFSAPTRR